MPRILIVEDDSSMAMALQVVLEPAYDVAVVDTGADALKAVGQGGWDLVLLDVGLPDTSGLDVLAEIVRVSGPPVVMVTAESNPTIIGKARALGAANYLLKPVDGDDLMASVSAALGEPS